MEEVHPYPGERFDIRQFSVFSTFPQGIFIIIYVNDFYVKIKSIAIMDGSVRGVLGNQHSYRDHAGSGGHPAAQGPSKTTHASSYGLR